MHMKGFVCFILPLLLVIGCSGAEDIVLDVKVDSPVAKEVVTVCHNNIEVFPLDENGAASVVLDGLDAAYLKLFHGNESVLLYVEKGDRMSLSFTGGDMADSHVIEGDKKAAAAYLNTVSLIPLPDEDYALPFDEYVRKLNGKEEDAVALLKANALEDEGDFVRMEEGRIRYSYGAALLMYPIGHMLMSGDMAYRPDQAYMDHIRSYVVEDGALAGLDEYRAFIAEAMHVLDPDGRDLTEIYPKTTAQMKYAAKTISDPEVRQVVMHHIAAAYVDNFGVKDIDELENLYHTYVKDASLAAQYEQKKERWDLSAPGKRSPDFKAVDIEGKEYHVADFRGRYVYIDMWATWCGPCKREMPYLKELEEKFADAQIVFLGLSVDKDKSAWEKMVSEGGMTGVQLYLGTGSSFQEAYRIESIPRFILLDKDGMIVSNDMSRPSDASTADALDALEGIR